MNTTKEMIALIQEYEKNGSKNIEFKHLTCKDWILFGGRGGFNFQSYEYRIKPQPQEITLYRHKTTGNCVTTATGCCGKEVLSISDYELVTFREVIKEG